MAEPVPAGSDVSAGTYSCTNCGEGGASLDDPYPEQSA
jgi:hypothetical protein